MANKGSDDLVTRVNVAIPQIVGDIGPSIDSFRRHLRATNAAPRTIATYLEGVTQLAAFLAEHSMPTDVARIRREHTEAFVVDILERLSSSTANNRYRCLSAFFKFRSTRGRSPSPPWPACGHRSSPNSPPGS